MVELDISFCELKEVPELPTSLKSLNLSYNEGVSVLHMSSATNVESLNLAGCKLMTLPPSLEDLSKLQDLNVSNNGLASLNDISDWGKLPHLQSVEAEGNEIKGDKSTIPKSLFSETRLHKFTLTGNPVTQKQIQTLPGVDDFLERRKQRIDKGVSALQDRSLCGLST